MDDPTPVEAWSGDSLLCFDGRILEIFGFPGRESVRFHVRNLDLVVGEPNRRGYRQVAVRPASRHSGGCVLEVEPGAWTTVGPLLDRVRAAMED